MQLINKILDFFSKKEVDLLQSTFLIFIISIGGKVISLLVQIFTAYFFGGGKQLQLFLTASSLPETVSGIFIFGAIGTTLLPILVEIQEDKITDKNRSYSNIFNSILIIYFIISLFLVIFAHHILPFFIQIFNPNENFTKAEYSIMVTYMRILTIPQIILGISSFLSSTLQAVHRFLITQIAPIFYSFGVLYTVSIQQT